MIIVAAAVLALSSLSACDGTGDPQDEGPAVIVETQEKESAKPETETEEITGSETTLPETPSETYADNESETDEVPLTEEELAYFTEYIQRRENGGFLLSSYAVPQDIDLHQLLYNGIDGVSRNVITEEEKSRYQEVTGEQVYTDITSFTSAQLEEYLNRKMGIRYADVSTPLDWVYLPEYDTYYSQHGDANGAMYECLSGRRAGDLIYLECGIGDTPDQYSRTETTLKKNGEEYQFVSNQIIQAAELRASDEVPRTIELYEAPYQDQRVYGDNPQRPENPCTITISNVTDTTFDFKIEQYNPDTGNNELIFMPNTAVFYGDGDTAVYAGQQYELYFSFPDVTSIRIEGFEPTDGNTYSYNGIPGHEFS